MNAISAKNLFANFNFHGPCDLNDDFISKVFRVKMLLETLLKPENAAACELDTDEKSDFFSLQKVILTGLNAIKMLGNDDEVFCDAMLAIWKALSETIDEYFDAYEELKAAYQALVAAEGRFMEEAF